MKAILLNITLFSKIEVKFIYFIATNQMNSLNIPNIIAIEKIAQITSAQEAGSLKVTYIYYL